MGNATRTAWSEIEEIHEEMKGVRRHLLRLETRLARIEVGLELKEMDRGAEPREARRARPERRWMLHAD